MRFAIVAVTASLGGMLFGYDTGIVSGALLYIKQVFHLSATMQGLVTAIVLAGAAFGAFAAGTLSDRMGRRPVILGAAVLFIVGAFLTALTPFFWLLLVGRFIVGLGIGVASTLTPLSLLLLCHKFLARLDIDLAVMESLTRGGGLWVSNQSVGAANHGSTSMSSG